MRQTPREENGYNESLQKSSMSFFSSILENAYLQKYQHYSLILNALIMHQIPWK